MRLDRTRALTLLLLAACAPAAAQEGDRALAGFARPAASAPRSAPANSMEWERRLRAPERLGPLPLRAPDAALLEAARQARWAEVLQLVKAGAAHVNARDERGGQVLALAARAGEDEVVRQLIERGAELDRIGEDGFTALGAAAFTGRRTTVRLLLRAGADPQRWGATGQTALHTAVLGGHVPVLQEMLRGGVDIEMLNRRRQSAFDLAGAVGQWEATNLLAAAGANSTRAGRR